MPKHKWYYSSFPDASDGKESTCHAGDQSSIPGSGRSYGEGNGNPLQYSCLENPMNRGAWWGIVHRVAKNQAQLKWLSTHTQKEREYIISVLLGSNANHYTLNYVGKWYVCCCWRVWEWRCRRSWRQHKWKLLCLTCSAHPICVKGSVFSPLWGGLYRMHVVVAIVQLLSHVQLFVTPGTIACQVPLSPTISWSLLKLMSTESVMLSNHLILCSPLVLLLSIFSNIGVFSNKLALHISWPKYWSFSFSSSPSNEYLGLISFIIDWFDLLAVQGTLKNLLQHRSLKVSILWHSVFFMIHLSHPYRTKQDKTSILDKT